MLVLTRKPGEKIVIGDQITLTVLQCANGRTRLGIEAPRHVRIVRDEIIGRIPIESTYATLEGCSDSQQEVANKHMSGQFEYC